MQFWRIAYPGRGPYENCKFNDFLTKGFKIINSYYPYTYLDMERYLSPEKLKSWTPFNTPEQSPEFASQILGGETCSWESGNLDRFPYYSYTTHPSIALFGDKVWTCGDRKFDPEYKNALAELLFGSEEFAPVFECVGDLIPPRSCTSFTFVAPEDQNRELLDEMIEKLGDHSDPFVARAYALLLQEIKTRLDLEA